MADVGKIVGLVMAFTVIAIIFPLAMQQIYPLTGTFNSTGWNSAVFTIFSVLLPILTIVGLAIKFLPGAIHGGD